MTNHDNKQHGNSYLRFATMIDTSMVDMFVLMYLRSYRMIEFSCFR